MLKYCLGILREENLLSVLKGEGAMDRIVIGIAGGTGSGKTTIAKKIFQAFKNDAVILSHDYYYKPHVDMTYEERTKVNYDNPRTTLPLTPAPNGRKCSPPR